MAEIEKKEETGGKKLYNGLHVVGAPVRKQGDTLRVTGHARFTSDVYLPGMLYGVFIRSPYASADIVSIDTSEAEKVPGVKLIMTYQNFPNIFIQSAMYVGHEMGLVVATTEDVAIKARKLVKIQWDVKPFVVDPVEAMKPDAPQVFGKYGVNNVWINTTNWEFTDPDEQGLYTKRIPREDGYTTFGDVDKAFEEADVIVEDGGFHFDVAHAPVPERRGAVADYDGDRITIYYLSQMGAQVRGNMLFGQLKGTPIKNINQVRIVTDFSSGSFGSRDGDCGLYPEVPPPRIFKGMGTEKSTISAIFASLTLCKPVRVIPDSNEDSFKHYWGRGSIDIHLKAGFKNDGRLVAWDQVDYISSGLMGNRSLFGYRNGNPLMLYNHNCKGFRYKGYMVFSNIGSIIGWSGYGNPETMFGTEQVMDEAAEKLGIDPVELRKINSMRRGDNYLCVTPGYFFTGPNWIGGCDIPNMLDLMTKKVHWDQRKPASEKKGTLRHGIGMSMIVQQCAGEGVGSNSIVKLNNDGTAELVTAFSDMGQGGRTACTQIMAEVLGLTIDRVRAYAGDTDVSVWGINNACSAGTMKYGWSVYNASQDALNKLLKLAAPLFDVDISPEELTTEDGMIFAKPDPVTGRRKTMQKIPWKAAFLNQHNQPTAPSQIVGTATWFMHSGAKNIEKGCTFVELDVDTETGGLENVQIYHCADVGRSLNIIDTRAQISRIHHGYESARGGTMIHDPKTGYLLNGNYIDYPVATFLDCKLDRTVYESSVVTGISDPTHPYGACGLGQALQNGIHAATANAIYNAIGVRMKGAPFTPTRVLEALGKI